MNSQIAAILTMDGVATGAIYVLIALGFVLIFAVTRIIFVPFGDITTFTALTLADLEAKRLPGTASMIAVLAVVATLMQVTALLRAGAANGIPRALLYYLALPLIPVAIVSATAGTLLPAPLRILFTVVLILPLGPLLNRIVFWPIADASVLLLLIVSVALHFALVGMGLFFFGPEGVRTRGLVDFSAEIAGTVVSGETLLIIGSAAFFSLLLYLFFNFTLYGKALHATAMNRTGARLMGIRPQQSGTIAFLLGSLLAAASGVLIAPVDTLFYDSGFLIGLKAFVGAIIGGLVSFPVTAIGSVFIGVFESFAAFESSPFKEVIVFSILIPVLLWRSYSFVQPEDEADE